jgi:hypothetical protein
MPATPFAIAGNGDPCFHMSDTFDFGQVINPENGKQDVLCGEFTSSGKAGNHWISFATTKSRFQSPGAGNYEQWIGGQAEIVCKVENVTESDDEDLSSTLQQRLDHFTKKP